MLRFAAGGADAAAASRRRDTSRRSLSARRRLVAEATATARSKRIAPNANLPAREAAGAAARARRNSGRATRITVCVRSRRRCERTSGNPATRVRISGSSSAMQASHMLGLQRGDKRQRGAQRIDDALVWSRLRRAGRTNEDSPTAALRPRARAPESSETCRRRALRRQKRRRRGHGRRGSRSRAVVPSPFGDRRTAASPSAQKLMSARLVRAVRLVRRARRARSFRAG